MRKLAIVGLCVFASARARADDGVHATATDPHASDAITAGAAVGAGGQGDDSYAAVELRVDAIWDGVKIGLGARGVWIGGAFRQGDWARPADAVTVLRYLEGATTFDGDGTVAIAAGGLAPAHVAELADGYRAQLDDRLHTGTRVAVTDGRLEVGAEIDDVLDPVMIGGRARWALDRAWGVDVATVVDPSAPTMTAPGDVTRVASAMQAGVDRRFATDGARAELGGAVVAEPSLGASLVAFGSAGLDVTGVRFSAAGDLRAGSGTVGSAFGPLYRIERLAHGGLLALDDRARMGELDGAGGGLSLRAVGSAGWIDVGMRSRPGLPSLATLYGGLPMGARVQAGVWLAASRGDAAGALEVRLAWTRRLFSSIEAARLYRFDPMDPAAVWSAVAWFGATTN